MAFYAVRKGFTPGIYNTWKECEQQTKGFPGPAFKKFPTREEADAFVRGIDVAGPSSSKPPRGVAASSNIVVGPDWDVVYSDGACKGNGQEGSKAGVGVWWGAGDPRNIAERCPGDQTNNRAELIAILRVLETTPMTKKSLLIRSDSKYSMDCVNLWIVGWKKRGWRTAKGEPVKNDGIIRLIDAHLSRRAQFGQTVKFEYVKGHSGDVGNDGADLQANKGVEEDPVPDRDWARDLERLQREQELDIPPEVLDDSGDEVELSPKAAEPVTRKRSRSPPRLPAAASSRTTAVPASLPQPPKTPVRNSASRTAAIEEALKSPPRDLGQPSTRLAAIDEALNSPSKVPKPNLRAAAIEEALKSPQADSEQPPRKRRAVTPPPKGEVPQTDSSSSRKPASKAARMADLEAALAGALAPASPKKPTALRPKVPARNASTSAAAASSSSHEPRYEDYPVRVIYALPPLVPVQKEEVNFDDYADCLLSDDELLNDIE